MKRYIIDMSPRRDKTLMRVFQNPIPANIKWRDIETMLISFGADIEEGRGSRIRIRLKEINASFHRPHPSPDTKQYAVRDVRDLLVEAAICDATGVLR